MNVIISFDELSRYINEHYGKTLNFEKVSEKEVCVSYAQKIIFKTMQIPINITIDEVKDEAVSITYNGGFGIDMMIAGALSFMKAKLPELTNAIDSREGHRLSIDFSQLPQTKTLVENLRLNEILILEEGIEIKVSLK